MAEVKRKKTFLDALNKVRTGKGKSAVKGAGVSKAGPVKLAKLAKKVDKTAARAKKKKNKS